MRSQDAALCARIAYLENGRLDAAKLGFSYQKIQKGKLSCWVGHKGSKTVVAIQGTRFMHRSSVFLEPNLKTDLVPWIGPGRVHEGYYRAFWFLMNDLKSAVSGRAEVCFTGHSMGAALAVLAGVCLGSSRIFCFASPKVGDQEFAANVNAFTRVVRFENRCDFLTRFPYRGEIKGQGKEETGTYVHVGRRVGLTAYGHSMKAYLKGVQAEK
ncbi:MAG: lipase family protein [Sneathiellales bacterium]|nr:lipase family protein [Sneathiellales bacterium]